MKKRDEFFVVFFVLKNAYGVDLCMKNLYNIQVNKNTGESKRKHDEH